MSDKQYIKWLNEFAVGLSRETPNAIELNFRVKDNYTLGVIGATIEKAIDKAIKIQKMYL